MRTQSIDTPPEVEKIQIEIIRGFSPARKFASVCSLNDFAAGSSLSTASSYESQIAALYGKKWAKRFISSCKKYPDLVIKGPNLQETVLMVSSILRRRQIAFALSGGVACAFYGLPSTSRVVEFVVDYPRHINLSPAFPRSSSSYIDITHVMRIDFSAGATQLQRARYFTLVEDVPPIPIVAPEDLTLLLLEHYRATDCRDDALYNDILGLLKVQAPTFDIDYVRQLKPGNDDLVALAFDDAGIAA
jgi:hypothetical protein